MEQKTKRCSSCKKLKPTTDFNVDNSRKDGLAYICRECNKDACKKTYSNNHQERLKKQRKYDCLRIERNMQHNYGRVIPDDFLKRCTKCNIIKSVAEFTRNDANRDGLKYWCRDCINLYNAKRRRKLLDTNGGVE